MNFVMPLLITRIFINSFNFIIVKYLSTDLSPFLVAITRAFITSILIFLFFRKKILWNKKSILLSLSLGIFGVLMNQTFFVFGGTKTIPAHTSVLYSATPLLIYIFSIFLKDDKFSFIKISGIIIGFSGIFLIVYEKGMDFSNEYFIGDMIILCGSIVWSIYTVFSKRQKIISDAIQLTLNVLFFSGILYTILGAPFFIKNYNPVLIKPQNLLIIVYFALVTSIISYLIWNIVIKHFNASLASLIQNIQIILTSIYSVFFMGFKPGILFYSGIFMTLTGIYIANRSTLQLRKQRNNKIIS